MVQGEKVAIDADDMGHLLELLEVQPEQQSCPDFEYLCSVSSEQCRLVGVNTHDYQCSVVMDNEMYVKSYSCVT